VDAGEVVAIYAAIVATGGLGWQAYTWRYVRRSRIEVSARKVPPNVVLPASRPCAHVTVVNQSEFALTWDAVWFDQDKARFVPDPAQDFPMGDNLPVRLEGRHSDFTVVDLSRAVQSGIDLTEPLVAVVGLSSRDEFRSKPFSLA
jgi:hypothetical protein